MMTNAKENEAAKLMGFEVLFARMEEAKHAELAEASAEIARISEPIQALAEATAEMERLHFTTFISSM